MMKKILVIDGNSILNRAFYGIRPLTTKDGKSTNAIYGMIQIIQRQLDALSPDYAAAAFDLKAPNFRKKVYDAYKAGRHETPPELLSQFADAKDCLRLMGVTVLEKEGYEADDILGTVAETAATAEEDIHTYILSGDRDLLQLISPKVTVLLAGNTDTVPFDREAFFEKYGIQPEQFVDMKAIMGDSSDNIPGVPGIGEKGAQKLIAAFFSLDGVYEHIDDPSITKSIREKLTNGKDSAYLSQFLSRIEVHVPLSSTLADLAYHRIPDPSKLAEKFRELEFFAFLKRFHLEDATAVSPEAPRAASLRPAAIYDEKTAAFLAEHLSSPFAVMAEDDRLLFADQNGTYACTENFLDLSPLFNGERRMITFDGKALFHRLRKLGVSFSTIPEDLMLYRYVLNPQSDLKSPDALLSDLPIPANGPIGPRELLEIEPILRQKVAETGSTDLLFQIELPLAPVLFRMEEAGFHLDTEALSAFGKKLEERMALLEEQIYSLAGTTFNLNSPKQLGDVLFERLHLPCKKKTKSGYSTDADVLNALRPYHPIIPAILDYRQFSKLYSTYVLGLLRVVAPDGRVHTDFKQALTATGRLSSAEPNLQNIPVRTELGREMRRFFLAENPDYVLVDGDYSQIELRLLAAISGDDAMISAFRSGEDIHRKTAATVFGLPEEAVSDELRKRAKAINFGIVYGIGGFSLSEDLSVSVAEATEYIRSYLSHYPKVDAYLKRVVEDAASKGYTETLFHRRRYIPELAAKNRNLQAFGKRVAMNSPIQGTAADIIKIAMIRIDRRLREENLPARLVMQVHDELIIEAHRSVAEQAASLLKEEMENAVALSVPLTVDVKIGDSWYCKN